MTWKTPGGERVLSPPEAALFASCVEVMIDFHRDGCDVELYCDVLVTGPFERLTDPEKYTVLEQVTYQLLSATPLLPKLTAVNESCVYYVFSWLKAQFDNQIEFSEDVFGQKVLAALAAGVAEAEQEEEGEDAASAADLAGDGVPGRSKVGRCSGVHRRQDSVGQGLRDGGHVSGPGTQRRRNDGQDAN